MGLKRYWPLLTLIAAVILVQLFTVAIGKKFYLTQLTMSAFYALVVIGLCLLMGYAGQISIGQAGFFAIGGYTTATLTTINFKSISSQPFVAFLDRIGFLLEKESLYGEQIIYLSPWIALLAVIIFSVGIAFLIGMPVLKLRGHYLAMATLGFGAIIYRIVLSSRIFGEADGITGVPAFTIVPGIDVSDKISERIINYYVAWLLVILGIFIAVNLIHSRVGRGLRSLHGNEEAASTTGIDISRYKLSVFILSAVYAAIGGFFMTHYNGSIGPSEAGVMKSVRYVSIVAVGGMANIWGSLLTGVVLNFLSLRGVFGSYDNAIFGMILILFMLFAPQGWLKVSLFSEAKRLVTQWIVKRKKRNLNQKFLWQNA